jgi:hypothetical protein
VYHEELSRDVRLLTLLAVAFFSPGKQAALGHLSRYLALLLERIGALQPSPRAAAAGAGGADAHAGGGGGVDADAPAGSSSSSTSSSSADAVPQQQQQQPGTAAAAEDSGSRPTAVQQQQQQQQGVAPPAAAAGAADGSSGDVGGGGPHTGNLLRYVPLVYVEVIVDFLTALRKSAESAVGAPVVQLQVSEQGARAVLRLRLCLSLCRQHCRSCVHVPGRPHARCTRRSRGHTCARAHTHAHTHTRTHTHTRDSRRLLLPTLTGPAARSTTRASQTPTRKRAC